MSAEAETGLCNRMAVHSLAMMEGVLAELACEAARDAINDVPMPDTLTLLGPASRGDLEAQRKLATLGLLLIHQGGELDPVVTLAEALMFARLAAEHGHTRDKFSLAMMLALAASISGPNDIHEFGPEAIARLELLADEGDERCARMLAAYASEESPQTLELAQVYRERLLALTADEESR